MPQFLKSGDHWLDVSGNSNLDYVEIEYKLTDDDNRNPYEDYVVHFKSGATTTLTDGDADDLLTFPDGTEIWFPGKRIANPNTHGTGCTLSSAIAANLAKGFALEEAIARAKAYLTDALNAQLDLGRGSGPLDHTLGGVGVENWMHSVPDAVHK